MTMTLRLARTFREATLIRTLSGMQFKIAQGGRDSGLQTPATAPALSPETQTALWKHGCWGLTMKPPKVNSVSGFGGDSHFHGLCSSKLPPPRESALQKVAPGREGAPTVQPWAKSGPGKPSPGVQGLPSLYGAIPLDRMRGPVCSLPSPPCGCSRRAVPDWEVGAEASNQGLGHVGAFYLDCSTPTALPPRASSGHILRASC